MFLEEENKKKKKKNKKKKKKKRRRKEAKKGMELYGYLYGNCMDLWRFLYGIVGMGICCSKSRV